MTKEWALEKDDIKWLKGQKSEKMEIIKELALLPF